MAKDPAATQTTGAQAGTISPRTDDSLAGPSGSSKGGVLRVLYLFAGVKRRSDLGSCLRRQGRRHKVSVIVEEVDVLRDSKKHNLLSPRRRKLYLQKVKDGNYFAVVASPPCGTFSRSRWRPGGPKPLRL